jgi:hypothetical protein
MINLFIIDCKSVNETGFLGTVIELLYKGYIRRSTELENDFIN